MSKQIYNHSCERMPELADASVSLTVTSPPYWNAIDYDIHASNDQENYRTRAYGERFLNYEGYLDWLVSIFSEVRRVTKPGGFCAIIIGTVLMDGQLFPVPFDLVARMTRAEWRFHQDIIWHKCTAGVKRAGVSIQRPYPGYYYPNIMNEYILLFKRPGAKIYNDRDNQQRAEGAFQIDALFKRETANNVWHIAPIPPGYIDHPAPFPEEIPYRLIQLYSYPGDVVLDPFLGSGQTAKVASYLNRRYIGYEVIHKYVNLARARINEPPGLRTDQLVVSFEKLPLLNDPE